MDCARTIVSLNCHAPDVSSSFTPAPDRLMIKWDPRYETGVPSIDSQHRSLFRYINQLGELANREDPPEKAEVDALIDFLEDYVASHFKYEESCMERFRCPSHEENMRAHQLFFEGWQKFRATYTERGPDPEVLKRLFTIAECWIRNHICKIDVNLRDSVCQ
jgi:hemerythrin